jgi:hypothetical protein
MTKDEIYKETKCVVIEYNDDNPGFTIFRVMQGVISKVKKALPTVIYVGQQYFKINKY